MRPDKHNNNLSKRRSDARVKMFLRHRLAWLWGYPLLDSEGVCRWRSLYFPAPWEVQTQLIDGMTLSASTYSRNKLFRDFPKALPRVVGDAEAWSVHIALKLKAVRKVLDGEAVDPIQALIAPQISTHKLAYINDIKRRHPDLSVILDRFAWWLSADIKAFFEAISWFEQQAIELKNIILKNPDFDDLLLKLFFLRQQVGDKRCESLLQILQHDGWKVARPKGFFIKDVLETYTVSPEKTHDLVQPLTRWLDTVLSLPTRALKHHINVLSVIFPSTTVERLGERWLGINALPAMISSRQKSLEKPWYDLLDSEEDFIKRLKQKVPQFEGLKHAEFDPNKFVKILLMYGDNANIFKNLQDFIHAAKVEKQPLDSIWKHPDLALFIARSWYNKTEQFDDASFRRWHNSFPKIVTFISAEHHLKNQQKRLHLFESMFKSNSYLLNRLIFNNTESLTALAFISDRLDHALNEPRATYLLDNYLFFAKDKMQWEADIPYLQVLVANSINFPYFHDASWGDVKAISRYEPENLISSLNRWGEINAEDGDEDGDDWNENYPNLLKIAAYLHKAGFGEVADYFADKKQTTLLEKCQQKVAVFKSMKVDIPLPERCTASSLWVENYPYPLQDSLLLLNTYHHNAPKVAEQQLSQYFPSKHKLEQQIKVLQQKLTESATDKGLALRLNSLQKRLSTPPQIPSPALLQKLTDKLHHAAYSGVLNRWHDYLSENLEQRFADAFDLGNLPTDSLGDPRHQSSLMALLSLSKATQKVAKKVLQARLQAAPWDLRDATENQQFLQLMTSQGIDIQPWLEGIGELQYEVQDNDDKPLLLSIRLEDDPLEVLHMGSHFQTCLSANSFNYFSVVANMADINKRIIYLRDPRGKIMGRCLFALNDDGDLLNFWAYSHLGESAVREAVGFFANKLALAMKTNRSNTGKVSKLLAHKWYNDGAESTSESNADFQFDDAIKQQLLTSSFEQATEIISDQFMLEMPRLMVAQHLLRLSAFEKRPELSLIMHKLIKEEAVLDKEIRFNMAKYLLACDEQNLAYSWVKGFHFGDYDLMVNRDEYPKEEIELLIAISPTLAYRVLIHSRRINNIIHYESRNSPDNDDIRLCYLGKIHELLYRPRKAIECYQAAIETKKMIRKNISKLKDKIAAIDIA